MRAFILLMLVGCATTPSKPGSDWRCWQRDPLQPNLPQGDVLFRKERSTGGGLELQSIHEQNGRRGATRLALQAVDDRYEATVEDTHIIVRPDKTGWTQHSKTAGLESIEVVRFEETRMTVTSIEQDSSGPVTTTVVFGPADCTMVDKELARLQ